MGAPTGIDVEALRVENEEAKKKIEELESTIKELQTKVFFILSFLLLIRSLIFYYRMKNKLFSDLALYIEVVFLVM